MGPNGSGKTSLFEAFNYWYRLRGELSNIDYFIKKGEVIDENEWFGNRVSIEAYDKDLQKEQEEIKWGFYFRTAHRNEPDFTTEYLSKQQDLKAEKRFDNLMGTDSCVSQNYQRLVINTIAGVYDQNNDDKSIAQIREELIGKIKASLSSVFEDLELTNIGNPLQNGSFYFTKGISHNFHYKNLSAGEKSALDLILDLVIKLNEFQDAVYCIDEPKAHMHTSLQSRVLEELYKIVPPQGQLWIATHSMGMLNKAKELEAKEPGSVAFLDFTDQGFDSPVVMTPSTIDSTLWKKFLDLTFGDLANMVTPSTVVFCEGGIEPGKCQNFDATIYKKIFSNSYPTVEFVSVGSCSEVEDPNNISMRIVTSILTSSNIIKLIDRDDKSDEEVAFCNTRGIRVLSKRHIESYLYDDEIIKKLCDVNGKHELIANCLQIKQDAITKSISRENPNDDIKSAAGDIMNNLKKILGLTRCGNDKVAFARDTLAPLITEDTSVYKELKACIFD